MKVASLNMEVLSFLFSSLGRDRVSACHLGDPWCWKAVKGPITVLLVRLFYSNLVSQLSAGWKDTYVI